MTVVSRIASLEVRWADVADQLNGGVRQYIILIRKTSDSELTGKIMPSSNTTSSQITGLDADAEYNVSVIVVSGDGMPFKSANVLATTDEGGE